MPAFSTKPLPDRLASAAPWWIALGVTGVAASIVSGHGPLLSSLALVGIGSDADLGRRLREALAADQPTSNPTVDPAAIAGLVRRVHAGMYALLIVFAWASLLHLASQSGEATMSRWWLAGDLALAAIFAFGYGRLLRRAQGTHA